MQIRQQRYERLALRAMKERGARFRAEFVRNLSTMGLPQQFRVIDCKSTLMAQGKQLVLRSDWHGDYTAVSHTFGMEVYSVFNCECTSSCLGAGPAPRYSTHPCPGVHDQKHWQIVEDILKMCHILMAAGAEYVWHDGVCIAQHDEAEVVDSIKHMGYIYANAKETVIFMHYVGSPMAPIRHDPHPVTGDFGSRWHTRVWTIQEAAVSTRRRYCVRVGDRGNLGQCKSWQELEGEIADWYKDESSIAVIDEDEYWSLLVKLNGVSGSLLEDAYKQGEPIHHAKAKQWLTCLSRCIETMLNICVLFPTIDLVLSACSQRDSKHEGDRINSILALAGLRDFVVPKDPGHDMESWTMEFFKRQGQQGLAMAVFSVNYLIPNRELSQLSSLFACRRLRSLRKLRAGKSYSWVPDLSKTLISSSHGSPVEEQCAMRITDFIEYSVLCDGRLQLTGNLTTVPVRFTLGTRAHRRPACKFHRPSRKALQINLRFASGSFTSYTSSRPDMPIGKADVPYISELNHRFPVIDGRGVIKAGKSFHANLVFAAAGLALLPDPQHFMGRNPARSKLQEYWSIPALLVTGDLQSQVIKLGFFHMFQELREILVENHILLTMFDKLVIL
ncbi:hypothetical protein GOP47_0030005 [Adiantum capillus-veneris]|nr:hypothetical protein GOP47_0030005 [Adiantum capillus-veneris]